jgi:hypothetical protein
MSMAVKLFFARRKRRPGAGVKNFFTPLGEARTLPL